ncbi:MAG TPA: type I 3-dehydroquinate dehydratase, partial [Verrucomicrobiota bacterium]|nr:type I 3-dehydroquinate dehydratase [Verrucomicrobiota bacterium]
AALAKRQRKCCIVSFHDFKKTPSLAKLKRVASEAQRIGSVIKIVTMANTEADVETLRRLLACKWRKPICVMGMGPLGRVTRVEFPFLGSFLTYGYLDKPAAPGQLSAAQINKSLSRSRLRLRP